MADSLWTPHPSAVALLALAVAVWVAAHRWADRADRGRPALLAAALVTAVAVMVGPLDRLGEERLLSVHIAQHLVLLSFVPGLVLAGLPAGALDTVARRGRAVLGSPAVCLIAGAGAVWLLHLPPVLEAGLRLPWLADLQHLALIFAGLGLAWPLAGASAVPGLAAALYLVVAEVAIGALGIWLAWSPQPIYASYAAMPPYAGLSRATDQSLAGAVLLVVEEPFLAIEFAVVFLRGLAESEGDDEEPRPS